MRRFLLEAFTLSFGISNTILSPGANFVLTIQLPRRDQRAAVPTNCHLLPFKKKRKSVKCEIIAAGSTMSDN